MISKNKILHRYFFTEAEIIKIDRYIEEIKKFNSHTNIVGKSTLVDPWNRHVLDSIQISHFIKNKESSILDMGTGAGIPGLILAINKFSNVSVVDSNLKKINFIKNTCSKLKIKAKIYHSRIELINNLKYNFVISRALSNLNKLFFYSENFLSKDTVLIFLKGRGVKKELKDAYLNWNFQYKLHNSISDKRGSVLIVRSLKKKND